MPLIKYYGNLESLTGRKEETIPYTRLRGILKYIRENHGDKAWKEARRCTVFINHKNYIFHKQINPTDTVHFFPPLAGG